MKPENIKVLVACEESQAVANAFRVRGFNAFSCDIQDCSGGHPEYHIKCDVLKIINNDWDCIIAHPPCTDLAVSGARWFQEKQKDGRQQRSIVFFMQCALAVCNHIAVENPISIMSTCWRKPDQIIQPWQFGHGEVKSTCLWLKNLPMLKPTNIVDGRHPRCWKLGSKHSKERSKTYPGIAEAMADQWGDYLMEVL